mgnify:CR=1 FL=1
MTELHVVLGSTGGAGNAITRALHGAGLPARTVNRSGRADLPEGTESRAAARRTADTCRRRNPPGAPVTPTSPDWSPRKSVYRAALALLLEREPDDRWRIEFIRLAAADLAKRNQIWNRAINTADRTKNEHDYSLSFLAPSGETVRPAAQNQSLDDAWVYGLMRQESRFITSACLL